jgi:hypothetical protein
MAMRRILLVVPVVTVALAAAGCTSGSGGGPPAAGGGASPSAGGSYQRFAACMRTHGQNVPDQDPDSGDVALTPPAAGDRTAWDAAMRACRQFLPGGGQPAAPDPGQLEGLRQYAVCMRAHGIEMTDPDPNTGKSQFAGRLANAGRDQILNDPAFQAADAACKDKLAGGDSPKGGGK